MTSNNLNKAIHFTECSGIDEGTSSFVSSMQWWFNNLYRDTVKNGASSVTSWNMILDQNHGPRLPSAYCKNCEGSVTYTGTQISYNDVSDCCISLVSHVPDHSSHPRSTTLRNTLAPSSIQQILQRSELALPPASLALRAMRTCRATAAANPIGTGSR